MVDGLDFVLRGVKKQPHTSIFLSLWIFCISLKDWRMTTLMFGTFSLFESSIIFKASLPKVLEDRKGARALVGVSRVYALP